MDMQPERSALNSFSEPIDLNQGSLPENASMDHSPSWNNFLNPVENRLSNYMLGGTDGHVSCINAANESAQSFSGWNRGESSSRTNNKQDGAFGGDSKPRLGWSSSFNSYSGLDSRSEDRSFGPSSIANASYAGNQENRRSLSLQNYSSNRASLNLNLDNGLSLDRDFHRVAGLPHNLCKSGHSEMEQIPTFYGSSSNVGTFSGSSSTSENYELPGPSFDTWGSSGQSYPGGSSSSNQPMETNIMQHPFPNSYSASETLCISAVPLILSTEEQVNPSSGVSVSGVALGLFPSSSVQGVAESSARTSATISDHGRRASFPFDTPRSTSMRNFGVHSAQLSRSNAGPTESRSPTPLPVNQPNTLHQPRLVHANEARGTHSNLWSGSFGLQGCSSSSSFMAPGERCSGAHEEINVRSSRRYALDYPMTVSAPETRNVLQDQVDWSFVPGPSTSSRSHPSGSHVGPTAGGRTYSAALLPHQVQTLQNHQRVSESSPWVPYNRVNSESGTRRSHFSLVPSSSSLPEEAASTSGAQHQLDQREAAVLMNMPGDDINGWRALAAVESRHRLIRQVLNAMRRSVHLQTEDYMLIDPFMNGFAGLHDRHRDMRLDVDNMSYEELLALEERIGNVSTGLSEDKIKVSMKQCKYDAIGVFRKMEPCCICQENYVTGEDIGMLDCGHEFHTGCIKQWLMLKNLCPICKMTALET